jgi:tRNA(Ile)-lysidine synthetase-like protein
MDSLSKQVTTNLTALLDQHGIKNPRLLLAVSGGRDSMAMLTILAEYCQKQRIDYGIAYVNHNLRGEESEQEEMFIKETAGRLNIPLFIHVVNPKTWEKTSKSIEMTARKIRYGFFEQVMEHSGYDLVATAHHRLDHLETMLIQLLQGGGTETMRGIPRKSGKTIRPMIAATREEIDDFVTSRSIPHIEDSSNSDTVIRRNAVRHKLVPLLDSIHAPWRTSFMHISRNTSEEYRFIHGCYTRFMKRQMVCFQPDAVIVSAAAFDRLHPFLRKYAVKRILRKLGWPARASKTLFSELCSTPEKPRPRIYQKNCLLVIGGARGRLWFTNIPKPGKHHVVSLPGDNVYAQFNDYTISISRNNDSAFPSQAGGRQSRVLHIPDELFPLQFALPAEEMTMITGEKIIPIFGVIKSMGVPTVVAERSIILLDNRGAVVAAWSHGFFRISDPVAEMEAGNRLAVTISHI